METERVVLFIDILGFSEYVLKNSSQDCYKILNDFNYKFANLNNSMQAALQHQLENESSDMSIQLEDYKHHILSDSIIITANSDNDRRMIASLLILIYRLSGIQFEMLRKNLPIRGAISLGGFYNRKDILFGKGLTKAAKLEKKAKYPRIVIDNIFIEKFPHLEHNLSNVLTKDADGYYFIDYFKHAWTLKNFSIDKEQDEFARKTFSSLFDFWKSTIQDYLTTNENNPKLAEKVEWVRYKFNGTMLAPGIQKP